MAGDARQHIDLRVAIQFEVDDIRPQGQRVIDRERKRRAAELDGIDAEQQMMHDGVADQRGLEDVLMRNAGLPGHVHGERAKRFAHGGGHQRGAARIHHRVRHPAHQVLAEADLGVHDARRGRDIAAAQIAQVRGNGRRAYIDREAIRPLVQSGPHADDLLAGMHRHGDLPRAGAQHRLQRLQHGQIAGQIGQVPFRFERLEQPPQVPRRVMHIRLLHLHVVQPHRPDSVQSRVRPPPCGRPGDGPGCRRARR